MNGGDLYEMHRKLVETTRIRHMIQCNISEKQNEMNKKMRQLLSDLRYFSFLDVWYPSLAMTNVCEFVKSSVFTRNKRKVYESVAELPLGLSAAQVGQIETFLSNIPKYLRVFCKCADYYLDNQEAAPKVEYVPRQDAVGFFAGSTFPALFQYCWCAEQGLSCVEGLCLMLRLQTTKHGVMSVEFRTKSYLRDVIRHFFHNEGIQKYLRRALGSHMTDLMHDNDLLAFDVTGKINSKYAELLLGYARKFRHGLVESVSLFPSLLKYFFKRAFEIGKMELVTILFFDFLLSPALINPQVFAITSETTHVVRTKRVLSDLSRMFWWATNPSTAQQDAMAKDLKEILQGTEFSDISLQWILDHLANGQEGLTGLSLLQMNAVTNMGYHWFLLSANDLQLVSDIVRFSVDHISLEEPGIRVDTERATDFQIKLSSDEVIDFWFQCRKLPAASQRGLKGLIQPEPTDLIIPIFQGYNASLPQNMPNITGLMKYLTETRPNPAAPHTLNAFLDFQLAQARKSRETILESKLKAVQNQLRRAESEKAVCAALNAAILKGLDETKRDLVVAFRHQECLGLLVREAMAAGIVNDMYTPIIHQAIIGLFVNKQKDIAKELITNNLEYLCRPDVWKERLKTLVEDLHAFAESLGLTEPDHHLGLTRQFHSELCAQLSFARYQNQHPDIADIDKALTSSYDTALTRFLEEQHYSQVLSQIFQNPACFEPAIEMFQIGTVHGSPLELLERIGLYLTAIQDIYSFEAGEGCPGDDLLPLCVYSIIRCKLPNLYSLSEYLQGMLISTNESVKLLRPRERYIATTFISGVTACLELCDIHPVN